MERVKVYQMNVSEDYSWAQRMSTFLSSACKKKKKEIQINIYILPQGHVRLLLGK